ncbi:hypothetical protein E2320_002429 [Naja naja]|nr:hypothetical protein E2320_002429 [Naja naja]
MTNMGLRAIYFQQTINSCSFWHFSEAAVEFLMQFNFLKSACLHSTQQWKQKIEAAVEFLMQFNFFKKVFVFTAHNSGNQKCAGNYFFFLIHTGTNDSEDY